MGGLVSYRFETFEWEGRVEPVFLDSQMVNITTALDQIMQGVPCIKFREVAASYHGPHLIFSLSDGIGCYSNVGRTGSNGQIVNLGSADCLKIGIIIHETLHALGPVHEHSRPDRDLYVSILFDNIEPKSRRNFGKVESRMYNTRSTPFDISSIMMYGPEDFGVMDSQGRRKKTIQPLQPGIELRGAESKSGLSLVDKIELGRAYQPLTVDSCFHVRSLGQYAEYVDSLRQQECCVENPDLVYAAIEGNLQKVKNMLRFVDPNSVTFKDNRDTTFALFEAAERGYVEIMKVLIAAGADVDLQVERSNGDLWDTALHIATWRGHLSAVKILVASGASLTIQKVTRDTAVEVALNRVYAITDNQTYWQIFKFLVRNGAPLDFNVAGENARVLSGQHGWVIPEQY